MSPARRRPSLRQSLSRTAVVIGLAAVSSVVFVVVATVWQLVKVTDANAERLAAQGQLLVAALGFAVAVAVGCVTGWYAWLQRGLLLEMRAERHERAAQIRVAQASKVTAWPTKYQVDGPQDRYGNTPVAGVEVRVRNASDQAVYNVSLRVYEDWSLGGPEVFAALDVIGPDEVLCEGIPAPRDPSLLGSPPIELSFTDSSWSSLATDPERCAAGD